MTKLLIFIGLFTGSIVGGLLGSLIGGLGWNFALSTIGSIAGIIIGRKVATEYF